MSDEIRELLMFQALLGSEYSDIFVSDNETMECLSSMYFFMICDNDLLKDKYFENFEKKYDKLTSEQQELVKKEFLIIYETQNNKKIKKKGMINYE